MSKIHEEIASFHIMEYVDFLSNYLTPLNCVVLSRNKFKSNQIKKIASIKRQNKMRDA